MRLLLCLLLFLPTSLFSLSLDGVLQENKEQWLAHAPRCDGYVSKQDCDDGDSTLFAGLVCLSGEEIGCLTVKDSQSADGRWWRSPRRNPGNIGKHNSFSRDMALGVLAYLVKTKDQEAAVQWKSWIDKNRPCLISFFGCRLRGLHRYCKDDDDKRCTITPAMFQMMYYTWKYIGLEPTTNMKRHSGTPLVKPSQKGYAMHLYGVQEYLRQIMGRGKKEAAIELVERERTNPFFMYLYQGKTDAVKARVLEVCPTTTDHLQTQWAWERRTAKKAWEKSMMWDCLFMANL